MLRKPHTIDIAERLLEDISFRKACVTVPLASDTVALQMKYLAENKKTELIPHLQNYTFALQMDQVQI